MLVRKLALSSVSRLKQPMFVRFGRIKSSSSSASSSSPLSTLASPLHRARQRPVNLGRLLLRVVPVSACVAVGSLWVYGSVYDIDSVDEECLPRTYDVGRISAFWHDRPDLVFRRALEIGCKVVPFLLFTGVDYKLGRLEEDERLVEKGRALKELLTNLGPAFIKLGQVLSSRPDLLPQPVLEELQKLCDEVPGFPTVAAREIIREELGEAKLQRLIGFDRDTKVHAAASLGQVYKLRLQTDDGVKDVAVKVQRPDMIKTVSLDVLLLREYAKTVERVKQALMFVGVLSKRKQYDVDLIDSFAAGSYLELDYANEAENQIKFKRELVPRLKGKIRVPEVFLELTSRKVLTTEWIHGKKLASANQETINKLVPVGVECFLEQLLGWGTFHADPHSGNLFVDEQNRLVLIDFGLVAQVPLPDTKTMTSAVVHLMEGDVEGLLKDAVKLNFLPEDTDCAGLLEELQTIFDESRLEMAMPTRSSMFQYEAIQQRRKKFDQVSMELNSVFLRYPFLVPDYFALITRALIVLEGIAVVGNPSFDIFEAAYPFALKKTQMLLDHSDKVSIGRAAMNQATWATWRRT